MAKAAGKASKRAGADGALVLGLYRGAPQRRTGRSSDFTQTMAERFCATLADTCNVTLAAASIKRSITNVYKWRAKDATFRAAWDAALAMGYSRLELMLLERALHGVEKVVVARDGTTSVMREYSDRTALTLLRMHREKAVLAEESVDAREHEEACERIIAKLGRLKARVAADAGGDAGATAVLRDDEARVDVPQTSTAMSGGHGSCFISTGSAPPQDERGGIETKSAARLAVIRRALRRAAAIRGGLARG